MPKHPVFILSDRSGATAQTISYTLLTQFPLVEFDIRALPFIDQVDKVEQAITVIDQVAQDTGIKPLVFSTILKQELSDLLDNADAVIFDLLKPFIGRMEASLRQVSSHKPGQSHGMVNPDQYSRRIDAVNYAMRCDDGLHCSDYDQAAVILIAVSRSGKTPTSLYLALHSGLLVANYPLTEEDFERPGLPPSLLAHKDKVYGLLIDPFRLSRIRQERLPDSGYASLAQCKQEIQLAKELFIQQRIPYCDSTRYSIEELGSTIKHQMGLKSDFY